MHLVRASSLASTRLKFGVNFVRIGRKNGVEKASFPAAIPGVAVDLILKNVNLTKYGKND
jgi:hypothetical protein